MNIRHSRVCLRSNHSPTSSGKPLLVNHSTISLTVDWLVIEKDAIVSQCHAFLLLFSLHILSVYLRTLLHSMQWSYRLAPQLAQAWVQISLCPLLVHIVVFDHRFGENCSDTALNAIQTNLIS